MASSKRQYWLDLFTNQTWQEFLGLDPPMNEMCSFIAFEELRTKVKAAEEFVQHLKPDFIDSFAESCQLEEV